MLKQIDKWKTKANSIDKN